MSADERERSGSGNPTKEEIAEEQKKINRLRLLADLTMSVIMQSDLPLAQAQEMVEGFKISAVSLFPGKEHIFELIYRPRFNRIIMEKYRLH
ncbi:MAG: hypothetical protein JW765_04725 [Deltaproteobacteria bacterium]|nr:hypothetical protein [Candidatus Zymogenaceae bacterium]